MSQKGDCEGLWHDFWREQIDVGTLLKPCYLLHLWAKIHDRRHKNSVLDMKLCESAPSLERLTSLGCSKSVMRVSGDASMGAWEGPESAQSTQNLYCHLGVCGGAAHH